MVVAAIALSVGCGADGGTSDASSDGNSGAAPAEAAPAGQATATVDGLDYTFDVVGGLQCSISDEAITFAFIIGDNEVTIGGGANAFEDGWLGSISLRVANPDGEPGPISYFPTPGDGGGIDGSRFSVGDGTMTYSGPMQKQPANDGSNPPPVDVGDGTISASC